MFQSFQLFHSFLQSFKPNRFLKVMYSEVFLQELLGPMREFCRSLDDDPQLLLNRYAITDDRQDRVRRAVLPGRRR